MHLGSLILGFVIGAFFGACVGFVALALCVASREEIGQARKVSQGRFHFKRKGG